MMKKLQILIFVSALLVCARAETIRYTSSIVGYCGIYLKQGWNEITVNFDQTGLSRVFTTLDKIVKFDPPAGIIGDEIVFNLDGYHQKYKVSSYDAKSDQYRLTKIRPKDNIPEEISFDWIPIPKVFWLNHVTTNIVCATQSGEIANGYKTVIGAAPSSESKAATPILKIVPVKENSPELKVTLQGGKINLQQ